MATASIESDLLKINQELLDAIARGDWAAYAKLCDASLSCFEPEACGQLVEGLAFHKFYFDLPSAQPSCPQPPRQTTIVAPKVRLLGEKKDVAVITYIRLVQRLDAQQRPVTAASEETRVWQRQGEAWRHVHFHRTVRA